MRPKTRGLRWPCLTSHQRVRHCAASCSSREHRSPAPKVDRLVDRLADARSGRVLFVSHCLLNQNVRYLGGATRPGAIEETLDRCRTEGLGICQMPCPEQRAWGGALKRHALRLYGIGRLNSAAARVLVLIVAGYTRLRYRQLARRVAIDIADCQRSGFEVVEVLGVGASPSCGVHTTLPLRTALEAIAACDPATLTPDAFNDQVVRRGVTTGHGLFIDELTGQLRRRHLHVTMREHDLLAELDAARQHPGCEPGREQDRHGTA